jgi:multimeric flavodoxin WrbA
MAKILIVYHSQTGNTQKMAKHVANGAEEIHGTSVVLKKAVETTEEDLCECDGLVIGSAEYFGYMAGAVKDLFDRTYEQLQGRKSIFRKPYCVFISAGNDGHGALKHIERICLGYQFKKIHHPVLAKGAITEQDLSRCKELGRIIAAGCEEGIF